MKIDIYDHFGEAKHHLQNIQKECTVLLFDHSENIYWEMEEEEKKRRYLGPNIFDPGEKKFTWKKDIKQLEEIEFQFQLLNNGKIGLPPEIQKLIVYTCYYDNDITIPQNLNLNNDDMYQVIIFNEPLDEKVKAYSDFDNPNNIIQFRKSMSLPDYKEICENEQHVIVKEFCERLYNLRKNDKESWLNADEFVIPLFDKELEKETYVGEYSFYKILKKQVLQAKVNDMAFNYNYSYIGGYVANYGGVESSAPEGYNFLMQFGTDWGNSDMLYIYYNPKNIEKPFYVDIVH